MRSLYGKFIIFTIVIMMGSAILAFLTVNTYYHRQLKGQNDEKNTQIAKSIATYISSSKMNDLENYLETQADAGYKLYVISDEHEVMSYGVPYRV